MAKVYTRTGDKGNTGLVGGTRVPKSDPRIDLYGEVDELNSFLGLGISELNKTGDEELIEVLYFIQNKLFDLGSNLACEINKREEFNLPQLSDDIVKKLEAEIDSMTEKLPSLKNFILPGGSKAASCFHICRTKSRKVERKLIEYSMSYNHYSPENATVFLNRLSDYFFTLSRYVNVLRKQNEIEWHSN